MDTSFFRSLEGRVRQRELRTKILEREFDCATDIIHWVRAINVEQKGDEFEKFGIGSLSDAYLAALFQQRV